MPYRIWITVSFLTPLFFRYHLPLSKNICMKKWTHFCFHENCARDRKEMRGCPQTMNDFRKNIENFVQICEINTVVNFVKRRNLRSLLSFYKKVPVRHAANRRKIRLIENNAKCRYLKKLTCKGTLRQVFYLYESPTPYHNIYVYCILIHTGKGGGMGGELNSEKVRGAIVHKVGRQYQHDGLYLQSSINSINYQ